jgi:hypothetical protein
MGRYEVLHRKAKAGVLTKICCSAATGARASVCVHHPPQALPHVKLLWTFSCEQPNVGHPFVRIKHSFRLLRNWLNEYKTQSMAKHDLCQDPNLFSLTASRIEICTWFLQCIACSLSTQSYSQVHAYTLQKTSGWTMNPRCFEVDILHAKCNQKKRTAGFQHLRLHMWRFLKCSIVTQQPGNLSVLALYCPIC